MNLGALNLGELKNTGESIAAATGESIAAVTKTLLMNDVYLRMKYYALGGWAPRTDGSVVNWPMVIFCPIRIGFFSPSKWPFMAEINGGDPITTATKWDDPPSSHTGILE